MSTTNYYFSLFSHSALSTQHSALSTPHSALSTQHSALLLLIGLPGSGKSTLAKQLIAKCPQMQLISTDAIRGQLFGDEIIQGPWFLIWQELEQQLQKTAMANQSAIFDATNVQRSHRRDLITFSRDIGFTQVVGIWLTTPVWLCLARNKRRDRQVPEEVIFRMHRQLRDAPPSIEEGLDDLIKIGCGV
ncbi:AAA family ATPase [Aulosira sp. FACHB-615]|uniref:AAA family ATPase n=1 Tax=Aulosira sp. FACHB-615 TaxID=2692777 RepID=UPI001687FB9A|nr:AAA family ATPase [Aulosira sp. FACHB-615]MBD2487382.1 AAA family ATPase [Aulosira sp. FACHB-615]